MIDATILLHGRKYCISTRSDPSYDEATFNEESMLFWSGVFSCPVSIVTDAILIPLPGELVKMRSVIESIYENEFVIPETLDLVKSLMEN